jgi:hypothetical protein
MGFFDDIEGRLLAERNRLIGERVKLLALRVGICGPGAIFGISLCDLADVDPGELQTRADVALTVITSIEDFVANRLPLGQEAERKGDVKKAQAIANAAILILGSTEQYSPALELTADTKRLAADIKRSAKTALAIGGGGLAIGAMVFAAVAISRR